MKTHCRCRTCKARRKLPRAPGEYRNRRVCHKCRTANEFGSEVCGECKTNLRFQPKCSNCGDRNWLKDSYRHRVELEQMRLRIGRYKVCYSDCHPHEHRAGSTGCKFDKDFNYRDN